MTTFTPKTNDRPCAGPPCPAVTPYSAQCHTVQVHWRLANTGRLVIGPEPKLVLAARARRDCELLTLRIDYPRMGHPDVTGATAEAVLVQVPHVVGLRRLQPDGEPWVYGQEGVDAARMLRSHRPEDLASAPEEVRWYGDTVNCLEHNVNRAPCIWWAWRGRVSIPRGLSVGVVVRSDVTTVCRAFMAGV